MNKVHADARSALAGLLADGMLIMAGGFGLCGIPEVPDPRHPQFRGQEPHRGVEQLRRRRQRPRRVAGHASDQEDDRVLCGREQDLRPAISRRRTGDRVQPAGHAGRADPRRRRRRAGLLHQDRRRHADRRRQGCARIRRRALRDGARHRRRPLDRPRLHGRHRGQPRLPQDGAEFQSDHGDRGQGHRRRGRASGASRATSIPTTSSPPASTCSGSFTCRTRQSTSSNAPCASARRRCARRHGEEV